MIKSAISSSHFYYVFFFESSFVKTADALLSLFQSKIEIEKIKSKDFLLYHVQIELDVVLGSEVLLYKNRSRIKNGQQLYWYDLYIGKFDVNKRDYFFVCYPYSPISRIFSKVFEGQSLDLKFYKAEVDKILKHMKTRGNRDFTQVEKSGLNVDITRYSAEIAEDERHAKKVNLIGANPLNSKVFDLLNSLQEIEVTTISLKLKSSFPQLGDIELSCDKLGNYRFWVKKDMESEALHIVPRVFNFILNTGGTRIGTFITKTTLLEND